MYKNILVISDNINLCVSFKKLISQLQKDSLNVNFSISPFSTKEEFNQLLNENVEKIDLKNHNDVERIIASYDLVFSLHCKQLFPETLVDSVKCINVHPGYNPINRGWYPQVFAIINDLPIGATIHEIDNKLDHGPIIAREFIEKKSNDTSETLYNRVVDKEVELLSRNLAGIISNTYKTFLPESEGDVYSKKDFNELLELDLNERLTMKNAINKLRALTHGDFKNAYFIDEDSGEKIFITIKFS